MTTTTAPSAGAPRTRRGLRAIAAAAAIALLGGGFTALAAPRASAAPGAQRGEGTLTVEQASVAPGGTLTISGVDFERRPADAGSLAFKLNDGAIPLPGGQPSGTVDANGTLHVSDTALLPDATGSFTLDLKIPALPADPDPKAYWIRALGGLDGGPTASKFAHFTVATDEQPSKAAAQVTKATTAASGAVTLTLSGTGYTPGSAVSLSYAGAAVSFSGASPTAPVTSQGTFSGTASLAAGTALAGDHTITVTGTEDGSVVAPFTTTPAVAFTGNPSPRSSVDVTAVNLPAGSSVVSLGAGSNWLSSPVATDDAGKAVLTAVTVPANAAIGAPIALGYTVRGATVTFATGKVVTPDDSIVNADHFTVTSAVLPNGLYQTAENPATGKLFATTAVGRPPVTDSRLLKLDATTLAVEKEVNAGVADPATGGLNAVYGIGLDNALGQIWVTNTRQNTVAVYAQDDLSLIKQFPASTTDHSRDVIVDEKTHKAYVSSASKSFIDVFDAKKLTYLERITLGSDDKPFPTVMSLDLDRTKGVLFTTSLGSPQAAAINVRAGNKVTYYDLGSNVASASGVALDTKRNRLYVTSQATNNLVVLNLRNGKVIADIPTGAGALNATYDPVNDLVYTANRGGGTFTVISPATLKRVANLPGGVNPNHVETGGDGVVFAVNKAPLVDGAATNAVFRIVPKAKPAKPVNTTRPAVSGTLAVGKTLTASKGSWTNATGGAYSYRWLRNGATIPGATASSYRVSTPDAGRSLQVRVTVKVNGFSVSATSREARIATITSKTTASFNKATSTKGKAGTATVKVKASGFSGPTGAVTVYDGSKKIGTATLTVTNQGVVKVSLKKLSKGTHTLKATYSGSSQITGSTSSRTKVKVS